MNLVLSLAVGLLFAIGVYLLLGKDIFGMAFGCYMLFNALNLLVMAMAWLPGRSAPLGQLEGPFADPLVQAMVLTAIIIGFGISTFLLLLAGRLARRKETLDAGRVRDWRR